jgi:hypothetical protein
VLVGAPAVRAYVVFSVNTDRRWSFPSIQKLRWSYLTKNCMDVKFTFLTGELEELYVKHPQGYIQEGEEHKVLYVLHKALYGLRQAPQAWNIKLDSTLISLGFEKSPPEHTMYKRGKDNDRLLLGIYVDDLLITGANKAIIANFKLQMKGLFKMSDLGLLSY